jgi:hypothetical protein
LPDHCIFLKALQLNSARNVHRALHGLSEPFFLDDPRKDFGFDIPKGVRDPNTYEKRPSQNATAKLGEKARARSKQAQPNLDQEVKGKAKAKGKEKSRVMLRSAEIMEDSDEELWSGSDEETRLSDTIGESSGLSIACKKQRAKRKLKSPTYPCMWPDFISAVLLMVPLVAVKRHKRSSPSV